MKEQSKQLEEMTKIIEGERQDIPYDNGKVILYLYKPSSMIAYALYNAGYRKQSEGEWIFEHEYYGKMICSNCKGEALVNECSEYVDSDFCPNCGAKMKGGEE